MLSHCIGTDVLASAHDPNIYAIKNYPPGTMARSRFANMAAMATDLLNMVNAQDELPPWTQDFIATSHDRLMQVHSYIAPRFRGL
jgi:hypothetical protein